MTFALEVKNVYQSYGTKKVLNNINLNIKRGEVVSIIGGSGCGKSTLLNAILGTCPPKNGQVFAGGNLVTGPNRNIGIVYQNYALYPFLTARQNVAFGLKLDQTRIAYRLLCQRAWNKLKNVHLEMADVLLQKVGIRIEDGGCYPIEMSGGMQQRVAIAQSLIMKPSILLLDEPFGAVDEATRQGLQKMILDLYQENVKAKNAGIIPPTTILLVTHELNEALYVSDRVVGLSKYHDDGINGATIVYDQPSPVFKPNDPKDFVAFEAQKEEIRKAVFSKGNQEDYKKYIKVWDADPEFLPGDTSKLDTICQK